MADKKDDLIAIVSRIKERFLRQDVQEEKFESIEQILGKPVFLLKSIDKTASLALEEIFKVKTIQDLASLNVEDPYEAFVPKTIKKPDARMNKKKELIEKAQEQFKPLNFDLQENIIIAQMIQRSWEKRQHYVATTKNEQKVICMGLDNAGKTALLSLLGGKITLTDNARLRPTRGVEWKNYASKNSKLVILDMGGQAQYRQMYIKEPEKYFLKISALLYVIDVRDTPRYAESLDYFKQIVQLLQNVGEKPQVLIFLHKSDPDIINDPDFKINQEYLRGEFFKILEPDGMKVLFEFDLFPTSIYNFSSGSEFTTTVKDLLDTQSLNDPMLRKVEGLGEVLDKLTNTMMNLTAQLNDQMTSLGQQMAILSSRVLLLEKATLNAAGTTSAPAAEPSKSAGKPSAIPALGLAPSPPPPAPTSAATSKSKTASAQNIRQNIMEELKTLFAKRRQMEGE